jgi:hypothetical protein
LESEGIQVQRHGTVIIMALAYTGCNLFNMKGNTSNESVNCMEDCPVFRKSPNKASIIAQAGVLVMTSNQSLDLPQASIEQLPATTRNQLRSTQILTSLPQIVSELVQNALDAGARQVEVGVDCREWTCWIRDNGGGITKEGMNRLGIGSEVGRYSELSISMESCICLSMLSL